MVFCSLLGSQLWTLPTSSVFSLWHHVLVVRFLILFILFCEDLSPRFFLLLPSHLSLGCGTAWWLGSFIGVGFYFSYLFHPQASVHFFFWYIWSEFKIIRCSQHTECEVTQTLFMWQSLPKRAWWWCFQELHPLVLSVSLAPFRASFRVCLLCKGTEPSRFASSASRASLAPLHADEAALLGKWIIRF